MVPGQKYRSVTDCGVAMVEWFEWHLDVSRSHLSCIQQLRDYKPTYIRDITVVTVYTGYRNIRGANRTSALL